MSAFEDRYGLADGESILDLGPAGCGKSHLLGTVCEVVPPERVLLLCCKPREKLSAQYKKYGLDRRAEIFTDLPGWNPERQRYEAKGYRKLFDRVDALFEDDSYDAVLLDPFTDVTELAGHHILSGFKVGSYGELHDTQGYFRQLFDKLHNLTTRLTSLSVSGVAKSPKFVLVSCHVQPPKDATVIPKSQGGGTKESTDQRGEGIEYEGQVLPQIEGSFRRRIASEFGWVLYTDVRSGKRMNAESKKMEEFTDFNVQVRCSEERHAKMASVVAENMPSSLPNNFKTLYGYLKAGAEQPA